MNRDTIRNDRVCQYIAHNMMCSIHMNTSIDTRILDTLSVGGQNNVSRTMLYYNKINQETTHAFLPI